MVNQIVSMNTKGKINDMTHDVFNPKKIHKTNMSGRYFIKDMSKLKKVMSFDTNPFPDDLFGVLDVQVTNFLDGVDSEAELLSDDIESFKHSYYWGKISDGFEKTTPEFNLIPDVMGTMYNKIAYFSDADADENQVMDNKFFSYENIDTGEREFLPGEDGMVLKACYVGWDTMYIADDLMTFEYIMSARNWMHRLKNPYNVTSTYVITFEYAWFSWIQSQPAFENHSYALLTSLTPTTTTIGDLNMQLNTSFIEFPTIKDIRGYGITFARASAILQSPALGISASLDGSNISSDNFWGGNGQILIIKKVIINEYQDVTDDPFKRKGFDDNLTSSKNFFNFRYDLFGDLDDKYYYTGENEIFRNTRTVYNSNIIKSNREKKYQMYPVYKINKRGNQLIENDADDYLVQYLQGVTVKYTFYASDGNVYSSIVKFDDAPLPVMSDEINGTNDYIGEVETGVGMYIHNAYVLAYDGDTISEYPEPDHIGQMVTTEDGSYLKVVPKAKREYAMNIQFTIANNSNRVYKESYYTIADIKNLFLNKEEATAGNTIYNTNYENIITRGLGYIGNKYVDINQLEVEGYGNNGSSRINGWNLSTFYKSSPYKNDLIYWYTNVNKSGPDSPTFLGNERYTPFYHNCYYFVSLTPNQASGKGYAIDGGYFFRVDVRGKLDSLDIQYIKSPLPSTIPVYSRYGVDGVKRNDNTYMQRANVLNNYSDFSRVYFSSNHVGWFFGHKDYTRYLVSTLPCLSWFTYPFPMSRFSGSGDLTGIIGLDEYVTQYAFMSTISPTLPSQQFSPPYTADFEWWSKYAAYGFYDGYYNGSSSSTAEKRFYNYVEKYNSGTNIVLTDRNAMWTPHHSFYSID